jgi:hypothetical protein
MEEPKQRKEKLNKFSLNLKKKRDNLGPWEESTHNTPNLN